MAGGPSKAKSGRIDAIKGVRKAEPIPEAKAAAAAPNLGERHASTVRAHAAASKELAAARASGESPDMIADLQGQVDHFGEQLKGLKSGAKAARENERKNAAFDAKREEAIRAGFVEDTGAPGRNQRKLDDLRATRDENRTRRAERLANVAAKKAAPETRGPTHTMTEAKAAHREHTRRAREAEVAHLFSKASARELHAEANGLEGEAKTKALGRAAQHESNAVEHSKKAAQHLATAAKYDKMIKDRNVMTAENTVAKPGTAREDFAERREARADRLKERSDKAMAESGALYERSRQMSERIPFGQPIHVGHHSEQGDRNFRRKMHDTMGKSIEKQREGENLARRAKAAESNRAISSDDPAAVVALKTKIGDLEKHQARMVAVNKAARSKDPRAALEAMGEKPHMIDKYMTKDFAGRLGVPGYALTNNSAEIRRAKQRLDGLVAARARGPAEAKTIGGVKIHESENRVKLEFGGKPPEKIRAELKSSGFRWSPTSGAWQRQSSNQAQYHAERIAKMMAEG